MNPQKTFKLKEKEHLMKKNIICHLLFSFTFSHLLSLTLSNLHRKTSTSLTLYLILNGRIQSLTHRNGNSILKSSWSLFISGSNCPFSV